MQFGYGRAHNMACIAENNGGTLSDVHVLVIAYRERELFSLCNRFFGELGVHPFKACNLERVKPEDLCNIKRGRCHVGEAVGFLEKVRKVATMVKVRV